MGQIRDRLFVSDIFIPERGLLDEMQKLSWENVKLIQAANEKATHWMSTLG